MAGLDSSSSSSPQQEERPRAAGHSSSSRDVAFPEYGVSSFYQHVQPRHSPSSPNPNCVRSDVLNEPFLERGTTQKSRQVLEVRNVANILCRLFVHHEELTRQLDAPTTAMLNTLTRRQFSAEKKRKHEKRGFCCSAGAGSLQELELWRSWRHIRCSGTLGNVRPNHSHRKHGTKRPKT
jgi:hypothetical protein